MTGACRARAGVRLAAAGGWRVGLYIVSGKSHGRRCCFMRGLYGMGELGSMYGLER
jgi:hypothetical protein